MNFFKGFDLYSAMTSLMYVFETFYFELTDGTYPVIPQRNCGKPWTQSSLHDLLVNVEGNGGGAAAAAASNSTMRIVNGYDAVPNSYPWTVSIRLKGFGYTHFCAGLFSILWLFTQRIPKF
jgi:hypothetical protein